MRVTAVEMFSSNFSEPINFSLRDSDPNARYQVREILGLDAEEIAPKFYSWGLKTGLKFYELGMKARDIVLRIVLNPRFKIDETYADIRDELYRAISADRTGRVVLHFRSGATLVSRIFGAVVKFEVPYFVKLPEVQITVRCNDPMFRAINPVRYEPDELSSVNPVVVPDSLSTSPHGFAMEVVFTAASASFTIQDEATDPDWKFKVIPVGGFLTGDILSISSEFSNKYVKILRGATTIQLADKVEPTSVWPVIFPGANSFHFVDIANFDWNFLEYYAAYWGV